MKICLINKLLGKALVRDNQEVKVEEIQISQKALMCKKGIKCMEAGQEISKHFNKRGKPKNR